MDQAPHGGTHRHGSAAAGQLAALGERCPAAETILPIVPISSSSLAKSIK